MNTYFLVGQDNNINVYVVIFECVCFSFIPCLTGTNWNNLEQSGIIWKKPAQSGTDCKQHFFSIGYWLHKILFMQFSNLKTYTVAPDLDAMVTAACGLCRLSLWPAIQFTKAELLLSKQKLRTVLLHYPDQYLGYIEVIHRILLTKEYFRLVGNADLPHCPSAWLQSSLAGQVSAILYREVEDHRKTNPLYKLEWKGLAEAFLEVTNEMTTELYRYWNSWFLIRNAITEQVLFNRYIVYLNDSYETT